MTDPVKPTPRSASKSPAKNKPKPASPIKKAANAALPPCIFMPTLLPDPFGESSPELCWELQLKAQRVAIRLTQFGWNARAFGDGFDPITEKADHLFQLRDLLLSRPLPKALLRAIASPWVLAYDTTGF